MWVPSIDYYIPLYWGEESFHFSMDLVLNIRQPVWYPQCESDRHSSYSPNMFLGPRLLGMTHVQTYIYFSRSKDPVLFQTIVRIRMGWTTWHELTERQRLAGRRGRVSEI